MSSDNAAIYYEAAQSAVAMTELTDSGDNTFFESGDELWSNKAGYEPSVKPNGLVTGGAASPGAVADQISMAAATAYLAGVLTSVAADTALAVARPDATHLLLTLASSGYTNCVASDIGKTVTGGTTGDTGVLIAYNNTTRQWVVDQTDSGDTFDDDDEALTIGTGTGAGDMEGVAVAAPYKICSITINSSGAWAVVAGYQGIAFSDTRAAVGGPPLIPTTSIEVAQVKYTSGSSGLLVVSKIKQVVGTSQERYDYPAWTQKRVNVTAGVIGNAGVEFVAALPLIHTGGVPKKVYASYYTPEFAEAPKTADFVPPETTHSVSSTQIYGQTLGATSSTLNQGTFNYYPEDGISDALIQQKNEQLWFKFKQNKLNSAYILAQGKLGISRSFPAADNIVAACTVSAETSAVEVFA
jgi:hypothetical protein